MRRTVATMPPAERAARAYAEAAAIAEEDVASCAAIGRHGLSLLRDLAHGQGGERINVLTHCNAGRLATVAWGTATAPMYLAHDHGIPIHVLVSETRPRNQGASLTAWELLDHGIPHTVVADNSAGHLLQRGLVDVVIVGADRVTRRGDVANKVGTYLKALAARAHGVPFHVALPTSTIDWTLEDGVRGIPIEQRSQREVTHVAGTDARGRVVEVRLTPEGSPARNDAFDVTPFGLVTGFITERGLCPATREGLRRLQPRDGAAGVARAARPRKLPATK
jgi:methylthioribose-1-phosphate isomerase